MSADVLICAAVDDGSIVAEGSEEWACQQRGCGKKIWVSPSGRNMVRDKKLLPVCIDCGQTLIEGDDEAVIVPPSDEQKREIFHELFKRMGER